MTEISPNNLLLYLPKIILKANKNYKFIKYKSKKYIILQKKL